MRNCAHCDGVSRVVAGDVTDSTIQAIAGWMNPKMIERYSHVRN